MDISGNILFHTIPIPATSIFSASSVWKEQPSTYTHGNDLQYSSSYDLYGDSDCSSKKSFSETKFLLSCLYLISNGHPIRDIVHAVILLFDRFPSFNRPLCKYCSD
ncbi:hypothetical protein XELAEV_18005993mg [Xenopus laevis]|uniref:Uncharacterized protein n=1 Tax=Xenopus laevis TaxID=8355 RepID=A0A974DY12_XENLA|nr:hypothetical protein XELAEV_18005993mg [Xenopus laevis]